jgi:transposase InsO family protein
VLDRLVTVRGRAPRFIRCDNGPELTANALRDWCRFTGAGTSYIEYNTVRPHSALGYLTPTHYAKAWTATHPAPS